MDKEAWTVNRSPARSAGTEQEHLFSAVKLFRARIRMAARTPVLPETILVGALIAQKRFAASRDWALTPARRAFPGTRPQEGRSSKPVTVPRQKIDKIGNRRYIFVNYRIYPRLAARRREKEAEWTLGARFTQPR